MTCYSYLEIFPEERSKARRTVRIAGVLAVIRTAYFPTSSIAQTGSVGRDRRQAGGASESVLKQVHILAAVVCWDMSICRPEQSGQSHCCVATGWHLASAECTLILDAIHRYIHFSNHDFSENDFPSFFRSQDEVRNRISFGPICQDIS
jgi:hypothetical protein